MNLVVLGATGGTGRLVVAQAVAAGHTVTALVRSPEKLTLSNPEGEATVTVYTILFATALAAVKLLQRPAAVSRGN
jgi:uncharacterized protein YbjT (DUF2867 family)